MNTVKLMLAGLCFLLWHQLAAQKNIKKYIRANLQPINSIADTDTNFADLEVLGRAIGTSKIVMLGEQSHGDAATFSAKTRIIKYLHQKMGFNVLVFESDFYALHHIWAKVATGDTPAETLRMNTYKVWARCAEAQALYSYITNCLTQKNPLIVAGMDCRHAFSFSRRYLPQQMDSLFTALNDSELQNNRRRFRTVLDTLLAYEYNSLGRINETERNFFLKTLAVLKNNSAPANGFWKEELINLEGFALNSWDTVQRFHRDVYMFQNLYWLCSQAYNNEKIIVWAHSGHIAKNIDLVREKWKFPQLTKTTAGQELYKVMKDSLYILGFTGYSGMYKPVTLEAVSIRRSSRKSFEHRAHALGINYGFIDFKTYKGNKKPFVMSGITHNGAKAEWTKIFDGIFYIDKMTGCTDME